MVYGVVPPENGGEITPSPIPLPIGSLSRDRSAVVGAGGHLFILEGTNSLLAQYAAPTSDPDVIAHQRRVDAWSALMTLRSELAAAHGSQYVQMFIPDKSSAIDSGVAGLGPVTPLLAALEDSAAGAAHYVSARAALSQAARTRQEASDHWLYFDSHTGPRGSHVLSQAIVGALHDASFMQDVEFESRGTFEGDLGARFFGNAIPEIDAVPSSRWLEAASRGRELVDRRYPERGHTGRMLSWYTPSAPIDARVLVFGNSFFGGGDLPRGLNFWVSRAFRHHRFIWGPSLLEDEVRLYRPDIIICQTVERFLPTVPQV